MAIVVVCDMFRTTDFQLLLFCFAFCSTTPEIAVHGGTSSGSTKINLEFNIRRANGSTGQRQNSPSEADFNYDLDGQAFVPPALINESSNNNNSNDRNVISNIPNNETMLHPQHIQRTEELRAHAAVIREQHALNSQEESFPTLQAGAAPTSSAAPLVGWTSGTALQNMNTSNRNVGEVNQEAFPTLASNTSNKNKNKKAIRGNIGATRRQFAAMTTSANNQQQDQASWGEAISSRSATSTRQKNRQTDLAGENFPTLGRPSSSSASASVNTLARQNLQRRAIAPSMNSATEFPSMASSGRSSSTRSIARTTAFAPPPSTRSTSDFPSMQTSGRSASHNVTRAMTFAPPPSMSSASDFPSMQGSSLSAGNGSIARPTKKDLKKPPSMSSASDFPAPPSAKQPTKQNVRQQMLRESDRKMQPENNILQADMTSVASARATIEDMKASLGQNNFKQLKKLTKTFAQEQLSPEGYIDQAAALFEKEYEDQRFWSFLPSLLQSCPNQGSAQHALKYMNSLKRQQGRTNDKKVTASARATSSKWSGNSAKSSNTMRQVIPPPIPATYATPRPLTRPVAASSAPRPLKQPMVAAMRPQTISSKKNGAWGAGGKPKVVRTNALPGSVGAAAASQGPQGGSATKYMAKQQKKEKQAKNSNNNNQQQNRAKKKKQKNELRDLAFGK